MSSRGIDEFLRCIDPAQDGRHTQAVGGQDPRQAQPGSRAPGESVPRFAEPLMLFDAAASALFSTEASAVAFAGQDQSWVAQDDVQHTAAHTANTLAGGTVSFYAHDHGLQFKTAAGPLSLRAHTDTLSIHADREATITSTHDEIHVQAQQRIECEPEVLQAIAKVESGGRSAFWRLADGQGGHVPAILYERHYFSRLTGGRYDQDHPDISWTTGYRLRKHLGKEDKKMHDGKVDDDDIYASYATSYLRLLNAYRLDPDAALQSCSWGKFQIMGANHGLCGEPDLDEFVNKMCTSEVAQLGLLAGFIQNKPAAWKDPKNKALGREISLWDAVKAKNWRVIAFYYNGRAYETNQYHLKLERAYEAYKKANEAKKA